MSDFLPARESSLFAALFRIYARWLFRRRFRKVWVRSSYRPGPDSRTVYYLNHNSWWDGLVPVLLNDRLFGQRARAMMEKRQIRRYPFFRRLGAFSVSRSDSASALPSLRYALRSMKRPRAALYIFPGGKITAPGSPLEFEGGLTWLFRQLPEDETDFVPVGLYIHTIRSDKPELHINVGAAESPDPARTDFELTRRFERALEELLEELRRKSGFDDDPFRPLL